MASALVALHQWSYLLAEEGATWAKQCISETTSKVCTHALGNDGNHEKHGTHAHTHTHIKTKGSPAMAMHSYKRTMSPPRASDKHQAFHATTTTAHPDKEPLQYTRTHMIVLWALLRCTAAIITPSCRSRAVRTIPVCLHRSYHTNRAMKASLGQMERAWDRQNPAGANGVGKGRSMTDHVGGTGKRSGLDPPHAGGHGSLATGWGRRFTVLWAMG